MEGSARLGRKGESTIPTSENPFCVSLLSLRGQWTVDSGQASRLEEVGGLGGGGGFGNGELVLVLHITSSCH
jgi:hypothetical protein